MKRTTSISKRNSTVAVIGAGSWGTAVAILLAKNGMQVRLWGRDTALMTDMAATRANSRYLPDQSFPDNLEVHTDLAAAVAGIRDIIIMVPSEAFAQTLNNLKPLLTTDVRIAWGTKGFDPQSGLLLHEVVKQIFGDIPQAVISGPSFAKEVANGLPTAVTVAANNESFSKDICHYLRNEAFRPYISHDIIGVEVGGVVKNILAIAAGIADGLGCGANAQSALITRGLVEVVHFGTALGGDMRTFYGLAGLGDLILTSTNIQSRNRRFGIALGQGVTIEAAKISVNQVIEGISNCIEVCRIATQLKIEMPITQQVYKVLHEGLSPRDAMNNLLMRDVKAE